MTPSRLKSVMPSLPVADLERAISFYTGKLGFRLTFENGRLFAIVARDGVELGLAPAAVHKGIPGKGAVYLKVCGIDDLYREITSLGLAILHPLRTEDYGMREFMIADPDGNTINYGEPRQPGDQR